MAGIRKRAQTFVRACACVFVCVCVCWCVCVCATITHDLNNLRHKHWQIFLYGLCFHCCRSDSAELVECKYMHMQYMPMHDNRVCFNHMLMH